LLASLFALLATIITIFFLPETIKSKNTFKLSLKTIGIQEIFTGLLKPKIGRIFLLNFFSGLTFTIFTFTFQPFFLNNLGQSSKTLALFFSMFGAIGVVMQIFGLSKITKMFNLINVLTFAIAIRGLMFILMPSLPFIQAFFVFGIILALVNSFPQAILSTLLSINSKDEEQGANAGLNSSYLSISNAIGPAIGGLLAMLGYSQALFVAGFLTLAVAALSYESKFRVEGEKR
jgi:predicted MFS family arabinose efflux permease